MRALKNMLQENYDVQEVLLSDEQVPITATFSLPPGWGADTASSVAAHVKSELE